MSQLRPEDCQTDLVKKTQVYEVYKAYEFRKAESKNMGIKNIPCLIKRRLAI